MYIEQWVGLLTYWECKSTQLQVCSTDLAISKKLKMSVSEDTIIGIFFKNFEMYV